MKSRWWWPFIVAFLVAAPSLNAGLALDDWMHHALFEGKLLKQPWWEAFSFAPGNPPELEPFIRIGPFPWFTLPELKLRFFRPLSAALLLFDHEVFGAATWAAHLHSVLWYLALVAVTGLLYRRLVPGAAFVALVLFALDDSHTMPVAWLANRNAVSAMVFAWLGLWAHLRWREDGWSRGAWVSAIFYSVGLLCAEAAIGGMAYVLAYELVGARPSPRPSPRFAGRGRFLLPAVLPIALYTLIYKSLGMGAFGSATYVDPGTEPLEFLREAPTRALANLGGQSFGIPADLWLFLPQTRPLLIGLGVLAFIVWPLAWKRWAPDDAKERRALLWLSLGALGALIPPLATFPATRLMLAPSLGLIAVVGAFAMRAWRDVGVRKWLGMAWLGIAFVVQPCITWMTMPNTFRFIAQQTRAAVKQADVKPGERVVVVTTSDFARAIYAIPLLVVDGQALPKTWQLWSMAPVAHRLTRVSETVLELETVGGAMIQSVFEQNFRSSTARPIAIGERVQLDGQHIDVLAVESGAPTRIRITLEAPLPEFHFVNWNGSGLSTYTLPAVGETVELPRQPTLFETDLKGR